ncbi:MAG: TetR/AcrR family transcriptional regulator [Lachnospiraceae bacterium]|nr:TetR/AcrR family transcriptional regulator [Lachnospiraceae bacterium]
MAIDMKEVIAEAAATLLFEKKVKKLTVKDIVEECNITRQAFYYHFEGIPELMRWVLEQNSEKVLEECFAQEDWESGLHYFFSFAVNALPYVERSMQSNYGAEIERMMTEIIYDFSRRAMERTDMYREYSPFDQQLILRYHCQAIMGLLRGWTEEDTKNMDHIVHRVFQLLQGKISPF